MLTRRQAERLLVIVIGTFALGWLSSRHPLIPVIGLGFIIGSILGRVEW